MPYVALAGGLRRPFCKSPTRNRKLAHFANPQRGFIPQPRVARHELPWVEISSGCYPVGGCIRPRRFFSSQAIPCFSRKEHRPWRSHALVATRHAIRSWPRNREATPLGLFCETGYPRGARSSQPWAEGCIPVGDSEMAKPQSSKRPLQHPKPLLT